MIVTCPSCATRYDLPAEVLGAEGRLVQCAACGASWQAREPVPARPPQLGAARPAELRAPESAEAQPAPEPRKIPGPAPKPKVDSSKPAAVPPPQLKSIDVKQEAARLARVSQSASIAFERTRQQRAQALRGWAVLAGCLTLLAAPAVAFPKQVTSLFPGAAQIYAKAGVQVNTRGLEFRKISYKRELDNGVLVLAIEGNVANVSDARTKVPPLRIAVMDDKKNDLYSWTLRAEPEIVEPGGKATFVSRLASPPSDASTLQVRFALPGEETGGI
ncbi:MAG: zinc-ribbon domain-containing protein [Pseudomonadota bacterium]